ncbi:LysR family transcriptional regulator [Vibrio sp. D404a]|uniref:LysR family transcriptional regulator n=1 Tax=unclassified Vibrio TaxID=2614977 RepID=UPI002555A968|nr:MULTISPECIES: LysR family transcriptional regulator [unclassified Vibrio]MDK9735942.1 LysR family transcriptional regulator [Vibrio sp. D404a]MDK9797892.1 LysR family transcriptional regulator [Vibrio sp. D449a]
MKSLPSQLPILIEVAKEKSFSAAARNLGISTPAVSKAINKLEDEWKLKLFHRSSHSLSLTSVGRELVEQLSPAVDSIFSAISSSQSVNNELSGTIKINLPSTSLGVDTLLPHLMRFAETHQNIELDLHFSDASVDLISHGFDLGIGTYLNQDSRLIAKRIMTGRIGLFASAAYAKEKGLPSTIDELATHQCIPIRSLESGKVRSMSLFDGETEHSFLPKGRIVVDSFSAGKAMLCQSWGIIGLADWVLSEELKQGNVVPVLEAYWPPELSVYLYFTSREYMPHAVRALVDYLSEVELT